MNQKMDTGTSHKGMPNSFIHSVRTGTARCHR
jgi:hypothetical protein